jgi:hypothetical protein
VSSNDALDTGKDSAKRIWNEQLGEFSEFEKAQVKNRDNHQDSSPATKRVTKNEDLESH